MYVCAAVTLSQPSPYEEHFIYFNDTATTEIYTLSLHDALPISTPIRGSRSGRVPMVLLRPRSGRVPIPIRGWGRGDRKSTRLNSSHDQSSYAVFCLKKKRVRIP